MAFAFDVVKTVRKEEPDLFDEALTRDIVTMLDEAVECELQFAEDVLALGVAGLSITDMRQYLEFIADQRLAMLGLPSTSTGSGGTVVVTNVVGSMFGIFFHSTAGANAMPFHDGFLCVSPPLLRHGLLNSGGTAGTCTGSYSEQFNAYIASGADPALVAGAQVWIQSWSRDPAAPFADSLSDAVTATICP